MKIYNLNSEEEIIKTSIKNKTMNTAMFKRPPQRTELLLFLFVEAEYVVAGY